MSGKKQQSEPKEAEVQMQDVHFTKVKSPPRVNQQGITLAHEGFTSRRSQAGSFARLVMTRVFSILAAIAALAVPAAAASAGTPEAAKGACNVPGFMDYTDDSCMAKPRWGSAPASALASRSGGEVVSDFAKSKPKPAVYDHGITQGRKKAAPPKPPGVKGLVPANVPLHVQPLLRRSADKALATGQHIPSATLTLKPKPLAEEVTEELAFSADASTSTRWAEPRPRRWAGGQARVAAERRPSELPRPPDSGRAGRLTHQHKEVHHVPRTHHTRRYRRARRLSKRRVRRALVLAALGSTTGSRSRG